MPENTFYESIPDENRREIAFNVLASVREAISIAQKKGTPPTYEQALRIIHDIDPALYQFCSSQLQSKNENELARLFKDKATAASLKEERDISAEELLEAEIVTHRDLINQAELEKETKNSIKRHIYSLEAALENMRPRRLTEGGILERDVYRIDRERLGAEQIFLGDNYVDYSLPNNRFLRVRILHPDRGEQVVGADLIYERFNMNLEDVRIAVLQYKVWTDNGTIYFSGDNNRDLGQMLKMQRQFCDSGICNSTSQKPQTIYYRFPYCSAFLRPTDRIQEPNSRMISTGIHIPICSAIQMANQDRKIAKSEIRHTAITHDVFEHLFNHGFLGSRALRFEELESFYREMTVLTGSQTLKVYAKEVLMPKSA